MNPDLERFTAKQAKEQSEFTRQELFEQVVGNIYREIKKACYKGRTSLRYISDCNLPSAWQTVHIFQPLMEELVQNGYSVYAENIEINGIDCTQAIEVEWDTLTP